MGVGELNCSYSGCEVTDTIFLIGANPSETQTNLFPNHMVPGIRKGARVVIVDPRRTVTVNACEEVAGADNVLHFQINSGTDLTLALLRGVPVVTADRRFVQAASRVPEAVALVRSLVPPTQ